MCLAPHLMNQTFWAMKLGGKVKVTFERLKPHVAREPTGILSRRKSFDQDSTDSDPGSSNTCSGDELPT